MSWKDAFPRENVYYETENGILYCGDCLEVMKGIPNESVDLIIADPPYNSKSIFWDRKDDSFQLLWLNEAKRILKHGGSFYCFFAPLNMYEVEGFFRRELSLKNVLVWYHPNLYGTGMSYGSDRWKVTWDVIFYAVKGEKAKHGKKVSQEGYKFDKRGFDVFEYPQPRPLLHKGQKPLRLISKLIFCSSTEQDLILDPFLGSGTTAVASEKLGRRWVGIELNPDYCKIAKRRIEEVVKQPRLL